MKYTLTNISSLKFSINSRELFKTFVPFYIDENHIKVVNVYDSGMVLIPNTHVSEFEVDGNTFTNSTDLNNAIHSVIFSRAIDAGSNNAQIEANRLAIIDLNNNKSDSNHNHDDRYYTQQEVDQKIQSIVSSNDLLSKGDLDGDVVNFRKNDNSIAFSVNVKDLRSQGAQVSFSNGVLSLKNEKGEVLSTTSIKAKEPYYSQFIFKEGLEDDLNDFTVVEDYSIVKTTGGLYFFVIKNGIDTDFKNSKVHINDFDIRLDLQNQTLDKENFKAWQITLTSEMFIDNSFYEFNVWLSNKYYLSNDLTSDSEEIGLNLKGAKELKTLIDNITFLDENNPPYLLDTDDPDTVPDTFRFTFKGGNTVDVNMKVLLDFGVLKQVSTGSDYALNFTSLGGTLIPVSLKSWFDEKISKVEGGSQYKYFAENGIAYDLPDKPTRNLIKNSQGDFVIDGNDKPLDLVVPVSEFNDKDVYVGCELEISGLSSPQGGGGGIGLDVTINFSINPDGTGLGSLFASAKAYQSENGVHRLFIDRVGYLKDRYVQSIEVKVVGSLSQGSAVVRNCFIGFGRSGKYVEWFPAIEDLEEKFLTKGFRFKDLSNEALVSDYRQAVIALCELNNDNLELNSWCFGNLHTHRKNGLIQGLFLEFKIEKKYNSESFFGFLSKNRESPSVKMCKFTYNGKIYGGIHLFVSNASYDSVYVNWGGNFEPFAVDYKDNQNGGVILNAEIANSLEYPTDNIRQGVIQLS